MEDFYDTEDDLIAAYLLDRLPPDDRKAFEMRMSTDAALREAVDLERILLGGVRFAARQGALDEAKKIRENLERRIGGTRRRFRWKRANAIAIAALVTGLWLGYWLLSIPETEIKGDDLKGFLSPEPILKWELPIASDNHSNEKILALEVFADTNSVSTYIFTGDLLRVSTRTDTATIREQWYIVKETDRYILKTPEGNFPLKPDGLPNSFQEE